MEHQAQMPVSGRAEPDRSTLEIEHLGHQIRKLELEIEQLRSVSKIDRMLTRYLPVATAILALSGFWFSVFQHHSRQAADDNEREDALRREAAMPFWDAQLEFYFPASKAVATIAVTEDIEARKRAITEFWTLYWGPLACVEDIGLSQKSESLGESKKA